MDDIIKTKGLVVKIADYGDNDRLITVLTEDAGKMTVTVRGGKSLKCPHLSSIEVFSYSYFTFKKGKKYYYLYDSELIEEFYGLRESMEAITLGSYFCEIANEVMPEGLLENDIMKLTLNAQYALTVKYRDWAIMKGAYEFKAAVISGFMPDLDACCGCGKAHDVDFFDIANGRLICADCLRKIKASEEGQYINLVAVSPAVLEALRFISIAPIQKYLSFNLAEDEYKCFARICEKYLKNHVEKDFYTLEFYKSVFDFEIEKK